MSVAASDWTKIRGSGHPFLCRKERSGMRRKRHTQEQIITKLREAEVLMGWTGI